VKAERVTHVSDSARRACERMHSGEDFWTVVGQAYEARELTRADLATIVGRGLPGNRWQLSDVHQQQCNTPVASYRERRRG
jgi:hypothetical protein